MATIDEPLGGPPTAVRTAIPEVRFARGHLGAPLHARGGTSGGFKGLVGFTFALAVSGFVGWENSGALAEGSRDPKRFIGTVPILIVYMLANIALPLPLPLPLPPSQPPPANVYWVWILAIVLIAAVGTAIVYLRRPEAIRPAGSIGPEFLQEDA